MSIHVAILQPKYARLILEGKKVIESRLSKVGCPPFGCIKPGERIYFKQSSGPFVATAVVSRVLMADCLTPKEVQQLRKQYDRWIGGTADYWQSKRTASYVTLIWLRDVKPTSLSPKYKTQNMRAWYVLDESVDPMRLAEQANHSSAKTNRRFDEVIEVALTAGAIRNCYVRLGDAVNQFPKVSLGGTTKKQTGQLLTLQLQNDGMIETDIIESKRMFRSRRWGQWFIKMKLQDKDVLRFERIGQWSYLVKSVRKR